MADKKCGNCYSACFVNHKGQDLKTVFCSYWVEVVDVNHECIKFDTAKNKGFAHFHEVRTQKIHKIKYPINTNQQNEENFIISN